VVKIGASSLRYGALLSALALYAVFGSPTPDQPGWAEIVTAVLLVFAVGIGGAHGAILGGGQRPLWFSLGRVLLIFGFSVPLLMAALRGNPEVLILRDVLPFLFMLLPVFLYGLISNKPSYAPYLVIAAVLMGLVFAARSFVQFLPFLPEGERFYFANAPTALFAVLLLLGMAGKNLLRVFRLNSLIAAVVFGALAFIPLMAMALVVQRASLGMVALYVAALTVLAFYRKPGSSIILMMALGGAAILVSPLLAELWDVLARKTVDVGLNMRWQEASAVWAEVAERPWTLLFGLGWGGTFHSPAVGELSVNFTHGLLTSMLLKAGLCGVILTLLYVATLAEALIRLVFREPVIGLALAAPIFIDVFLYASFKSLDFGLMLLLIPSLLIYMRFRAGESFGGS
jgi:hypothetical protein